MAARKFDPNDDSDLLYGPRYLVMLGYPEERAKAMILEYKHKFMNSEFCKSIGFVVRDDRVIRRILGEGTLMYEVHAYIGERRTVSAEHDPLNHPVFDPDDDNDLLHGTRELELLGYSEAEARQAILDYKHKFMSEEFCEAVGIPPQLNEFVGHEGPIEMAMLIHYYIGLRGDPNPQKVQDWRAKFGKTQQFADWWNRMGMRPLAN
jgi:hypothetical protein